MSEDDLRWCNLPVFNELHRQWWSARGGRLGESQRPFSRDWNQLLEDAGLFTAVQRQEAERDARMLARAGLVDIKPVKYRPHLISRISIPVTVEQRLTCLFNDPVNIENKEIDLQGVDWAPELAFLKQHRISVAAEDLLLLNQFFRKPHMHRIVVPVKERSLEIFGDEKRLDALLVTSLFRSDRLTLELLQCQLVGEPLGWKRGPAAAASQPMIIIENAATWHSYCQWNSNRELFSAVVYGKGFQSLASVHYLADIFNELGGTRQIFYFGDIDPPGLLIPFQASSYAQGKGMPPIQPHLWSYRQLLEVGRGKETSWEGEPADSSIFEWIPELAGPIREICSSGRRLAQEHIGIEFLNPCNIP